MNERDNPPAALLQRFQQCCEKPSDINEHLGILWGLARQCLFVTEFGIRGGVSTVALLAAQPMILDCYDINGCSVIEELQAMAGQTSLRFIQGDSRHVDINPTEMLHIDTVHAYSCLSVELQRHAPKVCRWIAMHDTDIYGRVGDDRGEGMNKAIDELVAGGKWRLFSRWPHNNGMTVLQRIKEE